HCARLRSVARTISLPVRMPAASALRSSTRYSAQRSSTALNQKATFVMCSSASPSTRSIESTSCCRGSLPKNCKPRSTSRTHKARREDRTLTVDLARCHELRSQLTSAAPSLWKRSKMGVLCAAQTEYGSSGTRFRISGISTDCLLDWWGAHILDTHRHAHQNHGCPTACCLRRD